jgi:flagellar biosynthesis protein FliQ
MGLHLLLLYLQLLLLWLLLGLLVPVLQGLLQLHQQSL